MFAILFMIPATFILIQFVLLLKQDWKIVSEKLFAESLWSKEEDHYLFMIMYANINIFRQISRLFTRKPSSEKFSRGSFLFLSYPTLFNLKNRLEKQKTK